MTEATITIQNLTTDTITATISGQLDESNVDEKIKIIYAVVENNPKNLKLILDLENLDYMNSKSIGYLTDIYGKITEGGGKMAIAKAKSNIVDILQVVGLTQLIESFATIEEAQMAIHDTEMPQSQAPTQEGQNPTVTEASTAETIPARETSIEPKPPIPESTPTPESTTATEIQSVTPVASPTVTPVASPTATPEQVAPESQATAPTPPQEPITTTTSAPVTETNSTIQPTEVAPTDQANESFKLDQ